MRSWQLSDRSSCFISGVYSVVGLASAGMTGTVDIVRYVEGDIVIDFVGRITRGRDAKVELREHLIIVKVEA